MQAAGGRGEGHVGDGTCVSVQGVGSEQHLHLQILPKMWTADSASIETNELLSNSSDGVPLPQSFSMSRRYLGMEQGGPFGQGCPGAGREGKRREAEREDAEDLDWP